MCFIYSSGREKVLCINKAEALRISGLDGRNLDRMLGGRRKLQAAVFNN